MYIKEAAINLPEYSLFVSQYGTIFNHVNWVKLYGNSLQTYAIFNNDHKLIGVFNLYMLQKFGLTYYVTPPYTPHIALAYKTNAANKANALSFHKSIITEVCNFLQNKLGAALISLGFPTHIIDMQPFVWSKFKVTPSYTYKINLTLTTEQIMQNFASDKRNSIKKAEKDGMVVKEETNYEIVKSIVVKTLTKKVNSFDAKFVQKILFEFATPSNSFSFVSYLNGKPISTAFCVYDNNCCYYLLGGYDDTNKHQAGGVGVLANAILHAKQKGLKIFDFEGSMLQEVEKFFRGFGGDMFPYYSVHKAWLPIEMAMKLVKRHIF